VTLLEIVQKMRVSGEGSYHVVDTHENREYQLEYCKGLWRFSCRHCTLLKEGAVRSCTDDYQMLVSRFSLQQHMANSAVVDSPSGDMCILVPWAGWEETDNEVQPLEAAPPEEED